MNTQYGSLREKIAAEKRERNTRYAAFEQLVANAHAAGLAADAACRPTPMIVGQAKSLFSNEIDYTKGPIEYVADGVCGFAWIKVYNGGSSFGRWLSKTGRARKGTYAGLDINCPLMTQSMQRKEAYCEAYARVLRDGGIEASMQSRID